MLYFRYFYYSVVILIFSPCGDAAFFPLGGPITNVNLDKVE